MHRRHLQPAYLLWTFEGDAREVGILILVHDSTQFLPSVM